MSRSSRWRMTAAAATVMLGLMAAPVTPSSAISAPHVHFMSPHPAAVPDAGNLQYHGGPVMQQTSTTYSIFWQPTGTYMSPGFQTLVNRYFNDIGGSTLYNNNTQYYDTAGNIVNHSTLGGTWTDTSAYPSHRLSDAQIQAEILKAMRVNGWVGGVSTEFFVYLARGEITCSGGCFPSAFCAYHGDFSSGGVTIPYANMPYLSAGTGCTPKANGGGSGPNHNPDADAEINATSHEHMEAVTDPLPPSGWVDGSGQEIGDKCAWTWGSIGSDGGNITMNGDRYILQQEWDNHTHGCTLAGP